MPPTPHTRPLQLLLAHADTAEPVLADGLDAAAMGEVARPHDGLDQIHATRGDLLADASDLTRQRWGVIAPEGTDGDDLLKAIEPLRTMRGDQQSAEPPIYRVPPDQSAAEALVWQHEVLAPDHVDPLDVPRYLLILGDLDQVSAELQQVLATGRFPGRLAFDEPSEYLAYARRIHDATGRAAAGPRDLTCFPVNDFTKATAEIYTQVVAPGLALLEGDRGALGGALGQVTDEWTPDYTPLPDDLLERGAAAEHGLLFTLSHGLGAPPDGWRSAEHQRALQGTPCFGAGESLDVDDLTRQPFARDGVWFNLSCNGAATPRRSAYHHWLARLRSAGGYPGELEAVLASSPVGGGDGFVARAPRRALLGDEGPLAFIGHLDLAWNYAFDDYEEDRANHVRPLVECWKALLRGDRVGAALSVLLQRFATLNDALTDAFDRDERMRARGESLEVDPIQRGTLWMQRQDLRGYLLLGDPAVRLGPDGAPARPAGRTDDVPSLETPAADPLEPLEPLSAGAGAAALTAAAGDDPIAHAIAARIDAGAAVDVVEEFDGDGDARVLTRRTIRVRD